MSEALEVERRAAADDHGKVQQLFRLQRYENLLPGQLSARTPIDAVGDALQPACMDVLADQGGRIAGLRQPCGINHKPLGKGLQELV